METKDTMISFRKCGCFSISPNVEALAKKGYLKDKCSAFAPKFHRSTNVQLQRQAPFLPMQCCAMWLFGVSKNN
jgi:hypothetical protein